jgi:hypothetical protein
MSNQDGLKARITYAMGSALFVCTFVPKDSYIKKTLHGGHPQYRTVLLSSFEN